MATTEILIRERAKYVIQVVRHAAMVFERDANNALLVYFFCHLVVFLLVPTAISMIRQTEFV